MKRGSERYGERGEMAEEEGKGAKRLISQHDS